MSKLAARPLNAAKPVMFAITVAMLTAPSSTFPSRSMMNIVAAVREISSWKLIAAGHAFDKRILASLCQVVLSSSSGRSDSSTCECCGGLGNNGDVSDGFWRLLYGLFCSTFASGLRLSR